MAHVIYVRVRSIMYLLFIHNTILSFYFIYQLSMPVSFLCTITQDSKQQDEGRKPPDP